MTSHLMLEQTAAACLLVLCIQATGIQVKTMVLARQVAGGVIRVQRPSDRNTAFIYEGYLGQVRTYTVSADGSASLAGGGCTIDANGRLFIQRRDGLDSSFVFLVANNSRCMKFVTEI